MICKAVFDLDRLRTESESLSAETQDPAFWKNPSLAKEVNRKLAEVNDKISSYEQFEKDHQTCLEYLEFLREEDDPSIHAEAEEKLNRLEKYTRVFQKNLFYAGPYDSHNAILEFHPGAGGTEAHDWAGMLLRMYERYAEDAGFTYKVLDILDGDEAGISSATLLVSGKMAYGNLRSEHGIHRLVRFSPFDSDGARHTSFASVNVMPEFDDTIDIDINPADLQIDTYHSSGAGGQNVNKTESAVRITHKPTGIVVSCQVERSQMQNKAYAMNMLRSKLFQLEEKKRQEKLSSIEGIKKDISFSSQIRSYVFCPYTLVKDLRTEYSEMNVQAVMDGHLQGFIDAYLRYDYMNNQKNGGNK